MNSRRAILCEVSGWKHICATLMLCAATAIASSAQTFTALVNLEGSNGALPNPPLVQGFDGKLYGTTGGGGTSKSGTAFRMTAQGDLETIYNFCSAVSCPDGGGPGVGLTLTTGGNFYGSTFYGGNSSCYGGTGCGTFFKMTASGTLTTLDDLSLSDGALPFPSVLVQASNGDFFGGFEGTVFKLTPAGQLTTLYNFCAKSNCRDGAFPVSLTLGADGALYGTTSGGGLSTCGNGNTCGTIFRITQSGELTTLYAFPSGGTQGWYPTTLVQATDGSFYGSTVYGGTSDKGTIFRLTAPGKLTVLYNFCSLTNCTDGMWGANFVQGTDGNFYGATQFGGDLSCDLYAEGCGVIFRMTPTGTRTTLHTFENTDGHNPTGLMQHTNGLFYGQATLGGDLSCVGYGLGCGTLFSLSTGLGPFVTFVRPYGAVGQSGPILGQGFTGTTAVSINGTPANFTVESDTYIQATVPTGATSGYVTVATPSGTLTSNVVFHVTP
jgi:uncharacterized repeat protein (TIGR03803 family)